MRHHVDLAEAGRRVVPVVERPDRHLAPDSRVEAGPTALAARRRDLGIDEQAVDRRGADAEQRERSALPSCNRPCRSSAGSKVGIITLSRLPHTRSDASHSAVSASLMVAP